MRTKVPSLIALVILIVGCGPASSPAGGGTTATGASATGTNGSSSGRTTEGTSTSSAGSSSGTTASGSGSSGGATGSASTGSTTSSPSTGGTSGTSGRSGPFHVLFDGAHKQVAGNACWIVDSTAPNPTPANPTSESSWSGGISAWAYDLFASGRYVIHQLPSGTALNYGQGGAGDLSQFDVFVSDEPELKFSSAEQAAMMTFANAGKGLFLISDHSGAVRCSGCTEATTVINGFLVSGAGSAWGARCDDNNVASNGVNGTASGSPRGQAMTDGPFGHGTQLSYHSGSTVSATGAPAEVVVTSSVGGMLVASELPSGGRLVLVGDSSPEEDGTTSSCSATLHDGWAEADDRVVILNATAWLAHDRS